MRTPIIAGNWKMNGVKDTGDFPEESYVNNIIDVIKGKDIEISIYPPFTHLGLMVGLVDDNFNVGVQNVCDNENGAFTGEVSAQLAGETGANSVILGHSERRSIYGETDELVCKKANIVLANGLQAVICIGETDAQNQAGDTLKVISQQFENSTPKDIPSDNVVIAYEPVWAIGTGRTPSSDDIQKTHSELRNYIAKSRGDDFANSVRILYGGSVNGENANEILGLNDVDGALVGGASLKSDDFIKIIESA